MNYRRPDKRDLEALRDIIGDPERVLVGDQINEEYTHDEMGGVYGAPDVVLRVLTAEEVSLILRYAYAHDIPVTPRGAGSGLVGASVAAEHGIIVDLSLMNRILELDEQNLTLTVEPGVLLMDITAFVEDRGYFYPPDPGEKTASIGGNINTNAGGMRAVKYGVTRDYVRGLEVVLPTGEIIHLGGKVVKNSSGYDLKNLIIGSEGTLGIVTRAILKLLPLPQKTVSLLIPFPSLREAIRTVPLIVQAKAAPTAIEFMEREVIMDAERYLGKTFPDNSADAYLLLKFDGAATDEIERGYEGIAELCLGEGALDVLISDTEERDESIWSARGAFLEAIKNSTTFMDEVDVVVPRSSVSELVEFIHGLQGEAGARIKCFGHAGDGNLHAYILKDDLAEDVWRERMEWAMDRIYEKTRELHGEVSGEHGIGYAKREYLRQSLEPDVLRLMRGVKQTFDPKWLLNPQKVL